MQLTILMDRGTLYHIVPGQVLFGQHLTGNLMIFHVSRRDLFRSGSLAGAAIICSGMAISSAGSAAPLDLDTFLNLSEAITGKQSLGKDMGRAILEGFISAGRSDEIATLMAHTASDWRSLPIANDVVAAWYSGLSPVRGAREVTGFNEALLWSALTYTKPWGSCGGETGYWAAPPLDQEL